MQGIAIFYKPKGKTSYDIIRELKKRIRKEKIGHGGSLDPLAEGILIIGIGKEGTKRLTKFLKGEEKEYLADIALGAISDTYDAEGKIIPQDIGQDVYRKWPSKNKLNEVLNSFLNNYFQTPPKYSAVKVKGEPAYKLARQGEKFFLKPKKVEIKSIELLSYKTDKDEAFLKLKFIVSSGFYVRSFANDLGEKLGTGAYLQELKRTRIGSFKIEEALKIEDIEKNFLEFCFKATGRVQGVFFRDTSRRWAKKLNLKGYAKNLPNRVIEIIAQGENSHLDKFLEKRKKGPILARVDEYSYYFRKPQSEYSKFNIY
jgi:tRNA pseudouridine55 synthase